MGYTPAVMTHDHAITLRETASARLQAVIEILAVAGAVLVGAQVRFYLPFTPVPITLQTLPVVLAPFAVGRFRATAGMSLYVALGALGAPLFATTAGVGATFGYLLAFILVPAVVTRFRSPAAGIVAGLGTVYLLGVAWLCLWLRVSPWQGVVMGVVPFLPGAFLKGLAAYKLVTYVRR
jgi:biotin transport system substrate-specific component